MELVIKVLAIILGLYLIALGTLFLAQRSFIYFPAGDSTAPAAVGLQDFAPVAITDTNTTSWWKAPRSPSDPVIIHFHGNGSSLANASRLYRLMSKDGIGVLAVGYPGYNGDPGRPSEKSFYAAAETNYRWLIMQGIVPERIVIVGQSIGGGAATYLASREKASGLILEAPFTSLVDIAARQVRFVPMRFLIRDRYPNQDRVAAIKMPLALIHGAEDRVIPIGMGAQVFSAAPEPKCFFAISGGGHNDLWLRGIDEIVRENARTMVTDGRCWSEGANAASARVF